MARLTLAVGFLLIVIGTWGFVVTGHTHPTSLIPALAGLIFVVCGAAANTTDAKQRMLWMHIAVTLSLLGFLGTVPSIFTEVRMVRGLVVPHPIAVEEKAAMSIVCLVFTLLCVRSFITARRSRKA